MSDSILEFALFSIFLTGSVIFQASEPYVMVDVINDLNRRHRMSIVNFDDVKLFL